MPLELAGLEQVGLSAELVELLLAEHHRVTRPRLERLWAYYRNPIVAPGSAVDSLAGGGYGGRQYRLAQEVGLPARLSRDVVPDRALDDRLRLRREIVVENDIGWRIHTMVDFMFGKPVRLLSTAPDPRVARRVERVLEAVWEASGGIGLLQDMALLGHVYGFVDLILRVEESLFELDGAGLSDEQLAAEVASHIRIELVEPTRAVPVIDPSDYRRLDAYLIHYERELNEMEPAGGALRRIWNGQHATRRRRVTVTEVVSATHQQLYENDQLVSETINRATFGTIPVVHVQNISQPLRYEGLSEVEPLIPLQDELNTRLSDRASRVTMQSFKMYLAKGIEGFDQFPVGPGQVWQTDNLSASIEAFGGDASSPSEDAHVEQIREALDKTSGVPPLATGVVRARLGNLSSANALRIVLMGILAKTARKRVTYGRGMGEMSALVLMALDRAGVLRTSAAERSIRLEWPDPLPEDVRETVLAARAKAELGAPAEAVLASLGEARTDPGIT